MNISEKGKQLIKKYEGCRLEAYKCPAGAWTIGWGHTSGVYEGMKITQAQADTMFDEDIKKYEAPVKKYTINQNQFDALTSFCYNCGAGALADVMSSKDVTGTMALYVKGGGVTLPGLIRRRKEEIELYKTPVSEQTANTTSTTSAATKRVKNSNGTYTVKSGDTLGEIASDFGVTVDQLVTWNTIANKNIIAIGQVLKLSAPTIEVSSTTNTYIVKAGDTLSDIASKYKTTLSALCTLNDISNPDRIITGQVLKISGIVSDTYHIVAKDENLSVIASKYGITYQTIATLNNIKSPYVIRPGQKLRVK